MDVNSILDAAVDVLRGKIRVKHAIINRQYEDQLRTLAVSGELRQVFSNVLANSLDALGDEGVITLRASESTCPKTGAVRVRVTVADNGGGIDPITLPRVFEPLFTTKEATGSGLGLWISKQLIEKYDGSIRLRSRSGGPRRGTTISVVLPRKTEQPA